MCSDLNYNGESDFWYFWNPNLPGCPQKARKHVVGVTATIEALPESKNTKPNYNSLFQDNLLEVGYLVGIDENFRNGDLGKESFRKTRQMLTMGQDILNSPLAHKLTKFEKKYLKELPFNIRFRSKKVNKNHYVFSFKKQNKRTKIHLKLLDPGAEDHDKYQEFHKFTTKGLKTRDLFIFDGHSGLGSYFDPKTLFAGETNPLKKDKYQIFFFNGCTTFPYYSESYFNLKKSKNDPTGRKNLNIITTAIPASFDVGAGQGVALIHSLILGKAKWKEIMDKMYYILPGESALTHVFDK